MWSKLGPKNLPYFGPTGSPLILPKKGAGMSAVIGTVLLRYIPGIFDTYREVKNGWYVVG